ncbi:MAG: flagellar hook-basal body complex protein [Deltaproteobacteria bacterium]|jgi:flagellar hook protein FlgE|nr:flagellar hook-basal body complex protein [Deltaproteobacteria bacterium]
MMGALYVGASGMRGYSAGLQTVSQNLANQNTIGFRQSMMLYQNLISQDVSTSSNYTTNFSQRGCGVGISDIRTNFFELGGFETGSSVTDLAISGDGFFGVIKDGVTLYTRAGNFRFDKDGNLLDPTGYNLVGKPVVDGVVSSTTEAIHLDMQPGSAISLNKPKPTSSVQLTANLGGTDDMSNDVANPFFSMTGAWDGTANPPLTTGQAGYSNSITVYDSLGSSHDLTVYYDYVGMRNGLKAYEYVAGINPSEDGSANAGSKAAGLLMSGTMTFSSEGHLVAMTAFTPTGQDPADPSAWAQAPLVDGLPSFTANFAGAGTQDMTLDFGLKMNSGWNAAITSPGVGASDPEAFYAVMPGASAEKESSTSFGESPVSRLQKQDGYGVGELSSLRINAEGMVQAAYSNGQSADLYQIPLYRFNSRDNLKREGKNHFSATTGSGPANEGLPATENFGSILSTHIEQSNVDVAREMTQMIITQRSFQMNSKVVTTSDQMIQKALELKRT